MEARMLFSFTLFAHKLGRFDIEIEAFFMKRTEACAFAENKVSIFLAHRAEPIEMIVCGVLELLADRILRLFRR
jgi:hypothetical protein